MKKVLVLTTSTGQGHNQAANSLDEVFTKEGFEVIKYDFLYNTSPFLNAVIVGGYEFSAAKTPKLFGLFYYLTDFKITNKLLKFLFWSIEKKLLNYINEIKPDLIIATHPLALNVIDRLKSNKIINVPFISIVTDFMAHYSYICEKVDAYITGSNASVNYLNNRGVPKNKIFNYGIPIKRDFYSKNNEILSLKHKSKDYFNILLMSGSMGISKISYVLEELVKNKHNLRITIICGKNEQLKEKLNKLYSKNINNKKIHIIGYTNDVSKIMDYSDILISKPGGLTSTEAIVKNIPLIIPFAIPGQETLNTKFLHENGYAIYIKNLKFLNTEVDKLITSPKRLDNMKSRLKTLSSDYSVNKIVDLANKLIKECK